MWVKFRSEIDWRRAAGELGLIVVGILIALWIDAWRQDLADRALEKRYLERLAVDLEEDIRDLEGLVRHTEWREANAREALAFLDGEGTGTQDTAMSFNRAGFISFFRHHRSTIGDLESTGNLALITDKDLLLEISDYYRSSDFLLELDETKRRHVWFGYREAMDRHVPGLVTALLEKGDRAPGEAPDLERIDWSGLRSDHEVRAGLERIISIARLEGRTAMRVRGVAAQLLDHVEQESRR